MANDRAIQSGKLHRKPYRKSKRHDKTCRNHGSCIWCRRDRLKSSMVREESAKDREFG